MASLKEKLFAPSDMTTGTPWKKIVAFMLPMLIGNIAQQLYNTVDSIIVGRYVGDSALAAVGSAGPILQLLLVLIIGVATGAGIMVSQYFGAKSREDLSHSIGASIALTTVSTIIIMILAPFICKPMLRLLNTPENLIDWCYAYLMILFEGTIGMALYNMFSGILRGLGDSISALLYLLFATFANIFLDLFFVAVLGWGVVGVALATAIAQIASAVLSYLKIRKMAAYFDLGWKYMSLKGRYAKDIIRLGLPSGITQMVMSLAMVLVQSLTNTFGEMLIAANVIVMRVDGFAMMPNFSFGMAMTTFAGQNVGARKYDRVTQGAKQGTLLAMGVSAVLTSLVLIFGRTLMGIFTTTDELVDLARHLMSILAAGYIAMAVTQCLQGVMRGAGDSVTPMWISMFTTVCMRVPLAYLFVYLTKSPEMPLGNQDSLFASLLVTWLAGCLITIFFYAKGSWKKKALNLSVPGGPGAPGNPERDAQA